MRDIVADGEPYELNAGGSVADLPLHLRTGQIATTVGLTVLAAAVMAMWGLLADLGLVDHGDLLVVKDILTADQ
jgi:hypothetical protein